MKKISKSDTTPEMEERANTGIARLLNKKSQHFAVGTYVMRRYARGLITRLSKDGGSKLIVEWENGEIEAIPNPHYGWSSNGNR